MDDEAPSSPRLHLPPLSLYRFNKDNTQQTTQSADSSEPTNPPRSKLLTSSASMASCKPVGPLFGQWPKTQPASTISSGLDTATVTTPVVPATRARSKGVESGSSIDKESPRLPSQCTPKSNQSKSVNGKTCHFSDELDGGDPLPTKSSERATENLASPPQAEKNAFGDENANPIWLRRDTTLLSPKSPRLSSASKDVIEDVDVSSFDKRRYSTRTHKKREMPAGWIDLSELHFDSHGNLLPSSKGKKMRTSKCASEKTAPGPANVVIDPTERLASTQQKPFLPKSKGPEKSQPDSFKVTAAHEVRLCDDAILELQAQKTKKSNEVLGYTGRIIHVENEMKNMQMSILDLEAERALLDSEVDGLQMKIEERERKRRAIVAMMELL